MKVQIWPEIVDFGRRMQFVILATHQKENGDTEQFSGYINWKPLEFSQRVPENCEYEMTTTDAQALMDRLWDCGIRPTEAKGSAGQLAAVQAHLQDLQRLVFERKAG